MKTQQVKPPNNSNKSDSSAKDIEEWGYPKWMWRQKPLYWQLLCFCKLSLAAVKEKVYVANTPTPHNTVAHFEYEQTNADEWIQQFGQT